MSATKRKEAPSEAPKDAKKQKTTISKHSGAPKSVTKPNHGGSINGTQPPPQNAGAGTNAVGHGANVQKGKDFKLDTSSAEAHAKQRALAKERRASKPNADAIERSKKIWEKLRRKSHVELEERKKLVAELFTIINGRVRDFVFKHDSVRVIQCALKYANQEQRRMIVEELKGDIRPLVESRYGKFLVAKMVVEGDQQIRDTIVPTFYGHVRRLINHPEASWIVDDIYRQVATSAQKATMLREWYGAEFALFHRNPDAKPAVPAAAPDTAALKEILDKSPEKRKPILEHLLQMINSLLQKKMTGFTMLHDAMLQYFLALTPGSEEHTDFLELMKSDIESKAESKAENTEGGGGDLFRNLAFTKSGSRLVCLVLAHGSAKDRKIILRCFKDTVELMALDQYAKNVLVVGLEVPDDTKMSGKAILHELLGVGLADETQRLDRLEQMVANLNARVVILEPLAGLAKWLVTPQDKTVLDEVYVLRTTTSKKDPELRRQGLLEYLSPPLLELVAKRAANLAQSSFGCQCIVETLLGASGDGKIEAKKAVADLAAGDPAADGHISHNAAAGRMLKTLVSGGAFDPATKTTRLVEPRLGFAEVLYPVIKDHVVDWACSDSSLVVVALLESEDVGAEVRDAVKSALIKGRKRIEAAGGTKANTGENKKGGKPQSGDRQKGNAGARILLEKLS